MKRCINSIRQFINYISDKMYEIYYSKSHQGYTKSSKGSKRLLDGFFIDKGTVATLDTSRNKSKKNEYIVYKDSLIACVQKEEIVAYDARCVY